MEFEMIHYSLVVNFVLLFLFYRLWSFFDKPGKKNFFLQTIKVALNRVPGATLIIGGTNDRSAHFYWKAQNDAIRPSQNAQSLPLQSEPRNLFHTWKGLPAMFAFEGFLSNTNPLETGNDDIELSQIAQANEVYVEAEVERRLAHNNPFKEIKKLQIITILVVAVGFIAFFVMFNDFKNGLQVFQEQVTTAYDAAKPAIDQFISEQQRRINENLGPGITGG